MSDDDPASDAEMLWRELKRLRGQLSVDSKLETDSALVGQIAAASEAFRRAEAREWLAYRLFGSSD